jgi:hypothetical protein
MRVVIKKAEIKNMSLKYKLYLNKILCQMTLPL